MMGKRSDIIDVRAELDVVRKGLSIALRDSDCRSARSLIPEVAILVGAVGVLLDRIEGLENVHLAIDALLEVEGVYHEF